MTNEDFNQSVRASLQRMEARQLKIIALLEEIGKLLRSPVATHEDTE